MSSPRCTLYPCTPILQIAAASPKYNFGDKCKENYKASLTGLAWL